MTYRVICPDCKAEAPRTYSTPQHATQARNAHDCNNVCPHCRFRNPARTGARGLCNGCYADLDIRWSHESNRGRPGVYTVEDCEDLVRAGVSIEEASERLGVKIDSIRAALSRAGRMDLYDRLIEKSPVSERRKASRKRVA